MKTKEDFYKEAYKEGYTDEAIKELIDSFPPLAPELEDFYWEILTSFLNRPYHEPLTNDCPVI